MKAHLSHSEWLTVANIEAAQVLANPKALHYLAPFIGRERSVGKVAEQLSVSPHTMLYWVRKFLELELLKVTHSEPRRGKPIKYYRAVSDGFFVPFRTVPEKTLETLLQEQNEPWQRLMIHNLLQTIMDTYETIHTWGLCLYPDDQGGVAVSVAPSVAEAPYSFEHMLEPHTPAMLMCWLPLTLTFEDAKTFQHELGELIRRYSNKQGPQRYLARLALTPTVKE